MVVYVTKASYQLIYDFIHLCDKNCDYSPGYFEFDCYPCITRPLPCFQNLQIYCPVLRTKFWQKRPVLKARIITRFYVRFCLFLVYFHSNEDNGVRQTLSLGVAFARGAAEVISFTFSILLITMCYNMVRYMRETFLNLYIPFNKNIVFHKIVAWTALAFSG